MKNETRLNRARNVRKAKTEDKISKRNSPLFEYNGWSITRWDDLNVRLSHVDDTAGTDRFYSNLGGALHGLVKQIGFKCTDLNHAVELLDGLNKRLTRAGL